MTDNIASNHAEELAEALRRKIKPNAPYVHIGKCLAKEIIEVLALRKEDKDGLET